MAVWRKSEAQSRGAPVALAEAFAGHFVVQSHETFSGMANWL